MIVKYSGNKQTFDSDTYVYAPIDPDDNLDSPYHDRLHSKTAINIGKNNKKSYILVEYMTGVK
jgi:hypothetical protein